MGSFIPLEFLWSPQWSIMPCEGFLIRTGFLCPWCLLYLVEIHFLGVFLLQRVFGSSRTLLWPMWVRCGPWRLFKTFMYTWPYMPPKGFCTLRIFFSVEHLAIPRDLLRPRFPPHTNTNVRILRAYKSQVYPLHSNVLGFVAPPGHFTELIDNVRTCPHAHVWPVYSYDQQ